MTTSTKNFCDATAEWNSGYFGDESSWICEPKNVVVSAERISDFTAARGTAHEEIETEAGLLLVWENQQSRPGCRRGNLFVMDSGDGSLSYFDGEA